jgi:hypothetical protein
MVEAPPQLVGDALQLGEIVASRRQAQQRQAPVLLPRAQLLERRLRLGDDRVELGRGQPLLSHRIGEDRPVVVLVVHGSMALSY